MLQHLPALLELKLLLRLERHTELEQFPDHIRELLEEDALIFSISLYVRQEAFVFDQGIVGRQHHQGLRRLVLELLWSVPLPVIPSLLQKQAVVLVRELSWRERPRTLEAGAIGMASAQSMCAGECDDLLIVETHAVEDTAKVIVALTTIRKTSVGSTVAHIAIFTTRTPGDGRAIHLLNGADGCECPQIRVTDPGKLLFEGLEEVARGFETGVCAVIAL